MDNLYPFLISMLIGFLALDSILGFPRPIPLFLQIFFSWGLGLGVTAAIIFSSLWIFGRVHPVFIVTVHMLALGYFLVLKWLSRRESSRGFDPGAWDLVLLGGLAILTIPLWSKASLYPYGGWDAWTVWNLKAKFLFLGGNDWTAMLEPGMWRSSPHYPLLLPCVNAWGWMWTGETTHIVPMITAVGSTMATTGILIWGTAAFQRKAAVPLKISFISTGISFLPAAVFLTSSFVLTLAVSQYADIVLGFYLLAVFACLLLADRDQTQSLALLGGLFTGFLSFTKVEGVVAAAILAALSVWYFRKTPYLLLPFILGASISALPAMLFEIFLSPGNQTFINGFLSAEHPVSWQRLAVVVLAFPLELISSKWNGLWIVLILGGLLGGKKILAKNLRIIPLFLLFYVFATAGYYVVNTQFEVIWFITSSLNRIVFALLPAVLFWIFNAIRAA